MRRSTWSRAISALGILGLVAGGMASTATAQQGPALRQQQPSLSCQVQVNDSIPTIHVSADATTGRAVVERRAFSRHWWRGVLPLNEAERTFVDTPLPRTAARVEYRVVIRDGGKTTATADCELVDTTYAASAGGDCVAAIDNGQVRLRMQWQSPTDLGRYPNVVFRRSIDGGPNWWRGVAYSPDDFVSIDPLLGAGWQKVDSLPSRGHANYQAIGRSSAGVINAAFNCQDLVVAAECSPVDIGGLGNPVFDPAEATLDDGTRARILVSADTVALNRPLIVETSSRGAVMCSSDVAWVVGGADGKFYFSSEVRQNYVGVIDTSGTPRFDLLQGGFQSAAVPTDAAVFWVGTDHLARLDRSSGSIDRVAEFLLFEGSQGNIATAPNGNVYYVLEKFDGSEVQLREWNDATSQERILTELANVPDYISVNAEGTQVQLLDQNGFVVGTVDIN